MCLIQKIINVISDLNVNFLMFHFHNANPIRLIDVRVGDVQERVWAGLARPRQEVGPLVGRVPTRMAGPS